MKRSPLFFSLALLLLLVMIGIPVAASPSISSVSPVTAPNNGDATITIMGSGYNSNSTAWIASCSTGMIVHGTVVKSSPTSLTCRFSLNGVKPGSYDVYVNTPFFGPNGMYFSSDATKLSSGFTVYQGTGIPDTTTTTGTSTGTTTVTTAVTSDQGRNSIFLETYPTGATIFIDGVEVGTSTFTYYTDKDGTFNVVAKKLGFEDYEGKVTVVEGGPRVRFYGVLTQLSSTTNTGNATANKSGSSTSAPGKNTTGIQKSTLKIPTPLGTDPPVTEESSADPALALGAAGIAIGLVLLRRR